MALCHWCGDDVIPVLIHTPSSGFVLSGGLHQSRCVQAFKSLQLAPQSTTGNHLWHLTGAFSKLGEYLCIMSEPFWPAEDAEIWQVGETMAQVNQLLNPFLHLGENGNEKPVSVQLCDCVFLNSIPFLDTYSRLLSTGETFLKLEKRLLCFKSAKKEPTHLLSSTIFSKMNTISGIPQNYPLIKKKIYSFR